MHGFSHVVIVEKNPNVGIPYWRTRRIMKYFIIIIIIIGKKFLALIDKHFPPLHRLHKLINRNTVKVGYSCTPNLKSIIKSHNKKVLESNQPKNTRECNCYKKDKDKCPLQRKCLTESVVHKATVTDTSNNKIIATYIGLTEGPFKDRYNGHNSNFNSTNPKTQNSTTLSTFIHECKKSNIETKITWTILKKSQKYQTGSRRCQLCLTEKLEILKDNDPLNLNQRSELLGKCRHCTNHKLKKVK